MTDKLDEALKTIEKFLVERAEMRGIDQEVVHALHGGVDGREVELRTYDIGVVLKAARAWQTLMKGCCNENGLFKVSPVEIAETAFRTIREYQGDGE